MKEFLEFFKGSTNQNSSKRLIGFLLTVFLLIPICFRAASHFINTSADANLLRLIDSIILFLQVLFALGTAEMFKPKNNKDEN